MMIQVQGESERETDRVQSLSLFLSISLSLALSLSLSLSRSLSLSNTHTNFRSLHYSLSVSQSLSLSVSLSLSLSLSLSRPHRARAKATSAILPARPRPQACVRGGLGPRTWPLGFSETFSETELAFWRVKYPSRPSTARMSARASWPENRAVIATTGILPALSRPGLLPVTLCRRSGPGPGGPGPHSAVLPHPLPAQARAPQVRVRHSLPDRLSSASAFKLSSLSDSDHHDSLPPGLDTERELTPAQWYKYDIRMAASCPVGRGRADAEASPPATLRSLPGTECGAAAQSSRTKLEFQVVPTRA